MTDAQGFTSGEVVSQEREVSFEREVSLKRVKKNGTVLQNTYIASAASCF